MNDRPENTEAEQQLLGALLLDGTRLDVLGASGSPDLFFDPVHASIFAEIAERNKRGDLVSPVALKVWAQSQPGMADLGGARYLVRLAGAAISPNSIADYAEILADLKSKRDVLDATEEAQEGIKEGEGLTTVTGRLEAALAATDGGRKSEPVSSTVAVTKALEDASAAYSGEAQNITRTHIGALDSIIGGFRPGELILLGGRPSMGKTAIALAIARRVAQSGDMVSIASLEMSADSLAVRMVSDETAERGQGVAYSDILSGNMSEEQFRHVIDCSRHVSDLGFQVLPPDFREIGSLYAGAKRSAALMGGLGLFVVDYLQLLRAPGRSRFEQIAEISIALKGLAMQLGVPILALSQLSRGVESRDEKRPMLSDLRESGQLEQDADTVLFAYRDEYYLQRDKPDPDDVDEVMEWDAAMTRSRNRLEIIVAKQRQGRIDTAHVGFNPATNHIWDTQ